MSDTDASPFPGPERDFVGYGPEPPRVRWPGGALVAINLVHICPWEACQGLLRGAGRVLAPGGPLILYGAYFIEGQSPTPGTLAIDASLRERDPAWGVRELGAVTAEARRHGLERERVIEMPSHNLTVVFRARAG